jgi:uncharacterized protein YlxW (UPF0749 family)
MTDRPGVPGRGPLPDRVTMPLLTLITQQSLDEDYLHSAERRAARGERDPDGTRPRLAAAAMIAVFGVLVTIAAVQTSRNAPAEDASRTRLISQVQGARDRVARQSARMLKLRARTQVLEEQLTRGEAALQTAEDEVERLQVGTGGVPVRGPGVRITVDDPEQGVERIRKEDLFLVINGLWAAGAEAIALNGHRLGELTSINNSDVAINVDSSALLPPYTLQAIGNPRTLEADLLDTATYQAFQGLKQQYGFGFSMDNDDAMTLPAAREERLRYTSATTTDADHRADEGTTP